MAPFQKVKPQFNDIFLKLKAKKRSLEKKKLALMIRKVTESKILKLFKNCKNCL